MLAMIHRMTEPLKFAVARRMFSPWIVSVSPFQSAIAGIASEEPWDERKETNMFIRM